MKTAKEYLDDIEIEFSDKQRKAILAMLVEVLGDAEDDADYRYASGYDAGFERGRIEGYDLGVSSREDEEE